MTARKRPAMKDVAAEAGVSVATASRSLAGAGGDPSTRKRVEKAAAKLNYRRDLVAQSLRTGRTRTVGMVIRDLMNPLFANIAQGVERRLALDGIALIVSDAAGDAARESALMDNFVQRRVDGLILALVDEASSEILAADRPVVLVDRWVDGSLVSRVVSDHRGGVQAGVQHLVGLGHERFAMLVGNEEIRPMRERRRGFEEALDQAGIGDRAVLCLDNDYDAATEAARRLLAAPDRPTAVVCGGLLFTVGLYRALHQLGLQHEGGIDVLGCDTNLTLRLVEPAAHFVARDPFLMGATAAELLLAAIDGAEPREVVLPTELLVPPHH